jgi:aryl-alcohol dehydrogenase-like predicted oxidoreductase
MVIADQIGARVAQVAIAWVLRESGVTSAIVGSSNPERARSNGSAAHPRLDDDALDAINRLIPLGPAFS